MLRYRITDNRRNGFKSCSSMYAKATFIVLEMNESTIPDSEDMYDFALAINNPMEDTSFFFIFSESR